MYKLFILITFALSSFSAICQTKSNENLVQKWVDQTYQSLSVDERIGQLFMVAAYSNRDEAHILQLEKLVSEQNIGGLIFFQGGPYRQARMTNRLQQKSKIPLFVGIDAEWGLAMRLDSTYIYPWNMSLGAIQNNELLFQVGKQMGEQAKRLGVHFMFAPVVDINTNPNNPVIGNRSYGENKKNVARKASAVVKGMQSIGVFATAKHFPGHGDTSKDSHHTLPTVDFSKSRIQDVELYPYKELIKNDLASIMVAHLEVSALEQEKGVPTSLSYATITNLLKNDLGFEGLIFTDALNMKGASNFKKPGEIDLAAFMAGNDVLLFSENVPLASQKIKQALLDGTLSEQRLEESVKKILKYKFYAGLHKKPEIPLDNLGKDLNQSFYDDLSFLLYENMLTLLQNKKNVLPLKSNESIAYIALGGGDGEEQKFLERLRRYGDITTFSMEEVMVSGDHLKKFDKVIIANHKEDNIRKNNEFSASELDWIDKISKEHKIILISFAKPYTLSSLLQLSTIEGILLAYQNNEKAFEAVSNALYGFTKINGKLPVSIGRHFDEGDGITLKATRNISVSRPALQGVKATILEQIDTYGKRIVEEKLAPAASILVLRNGKIVYNKSYGSQTYETNQPIQSHMIYDLASLSKILGTLPLIMKLYEDKKIKFEDTLGELLPEFKNTNKAKITVKELLTHQSGLAAWIPFYKNTLENNLPSEVYYRKTYSVDYPTQISNNLYLIKDYKKQMMRQIIDSPLEAKKYKYSDLNFILLQQIIERKYHKPMDEALNDLFFEPMNLNTITYNPLHKFNESFIAPTEIDTYYRHTMLQGFVHDMGAAMLGGVAGHAGLFSDVYDVAAMMQLFLDGGNYNGKQILKKQTIDAFNFCYYCAQGNRRGAGFDKPNLKAGNTCGCASLKSFGHTGFTGTMAWADPENQVIYVFLSNRTYPSAEVNRLSKANIREDIQQVIYNAIEQ